MSLQRMVLSGSLLFGLFFGLFPGLFHPPATFAQVRPRVVEAVDNAQRITLSGNVYPLARAEFDRGAVAESQPMNRMLLLLQRGDDQEAALQDYLGQQQSKSSSNYHAWLTPEQFGAQFGPADADMQVVTGWLTQQGFTIGKVYSGKTVIEFSGTAGQVQQAFGTAIHNYQVNGTMYSANASDPQIPAALAPVVAGVVSLHNFPRQFYARRAGNLRRTAGKSVLEPLTTMPNPFGPGNFYGMGPGDFAKVYGTPATCGAPAAACTGSGQTIAIVGETNLLVTDVQQFRSVFGLPATFDANSIVYNGEDPGITSTDEEGEADLDTQWSGAVAPGATIKYVLSASTSASQGVDLSALYIVEHNLAGVMSESYGACESNLGSTENSFLKNLWEQAAAQGITVAVSTGDSGSAGCDDPHQENMATRGTAVNGLASTPYNVAVGGTDFDEYNNWTTYWSATNNATTGTSALGYIPEIPWNQNCAQLGTSDCNINTPFELQNIVAGGGGPSATYNKPVWQVGTAGMPSDGKRDLPDISLFASPGFNGTGFLYCQSDASSACVDFSGFSGYMTFGVIGGTSASAPAFAGVMALVNQSQATSQNPAPRQGNANYILYALANKSGSSCASSTPVAAGCVFNDVTKGSSALPTGGTGIGTISVPCKGGGIDCSATLSSQIGVLVSSSGSTNEAWRAGAGYDMATGLGSLNIGNLVSNWGTVSAVPTSTTLTLSPTTGITHGSENVSVTIGVVPKNGTATGTVSLIVKLVDGTTFGAGQFTLGTNGSVMGTAQNLPGGTNYQVYAHYSGDGTNAPSDSAPVTVSVASESSKTFIVIPTFDPTTGNVVNGNATSLTYGSLYIIRMYVTNSGGTANTSGAPTGACTQASSVACPSGTVSLKANGNAVDGGTFTLDNIGYTRDIAPTLPGGTYPLVAAYSGDSSYTSSSASESFTVTPASTTLEPPGANFTLVGQSTPINATLTSQAFTGVAPTGTITFYDGTTALTAPVTLSSTAPTGSIPGQLYAQMNTVFTTTGEHIISAKYSGDANYAAATSAGNTPVSVVYPTSMSITVSQTTINYGQSVILTAVLTSQGKSPAITGQITFSSAGSTFTNVTNTIGTDGNGNQIITATATTVPPGTTLYFANYSGDANYESASTNSNFVNVNVPDFMLGPQSGLSVIPTSGQAGSGQITITPVSQIPSTVTLQLASVPNIAGYTISLSPQQVNLSGSAVQATLNLTPISGASGTAVRAQVRKAGFLTLPRGNWCALSLVSGLALLFVLRSSGRRRKLRSAFGLSLICILCFNLGCGGGGGSGGGGGGGGGGGPLTQSAITLTTSNPKVGQNDPLTITATVTGNSTFSGVVTLYDYGVQISNLPVDFSQPQAQFQNLIVGVHQLTAKFSGDSKDTPATSSALAQTVTGTYPVWIQGQTGDLVHSEVVQVGIQ